MQSPDVSSSVTAFVSAWLASNFSFGDSNFVIFGDNFETRGDLGLSSVFTWSLSNCAGGSSRIVFGEILLSPSLFGELDLLESFAMLFCGLVSVDTGANITGDVLLLGRFALDALSTLRDGDILVSVEMLPSEFTKISLSSLRLRSGSPSTSP